MGRQRIERGVEQRPHAGRVADAEFFLGHVPEEKHCTVLGWIDVKIEPPIRPAVGSKLAVREYSFLDCLFQNAHRRPRSYFREMASNHPFLVGSEPFKKNGITFPDDILSVDFQIPCI